LSKVGFDLAFEDAGEKQLKNIGRAVQVYVLSGSPQLAHSNMAETSQVANDQRSIVVLPFICLSDDRQHELLADGMTEDIITLLARLPGFFVIARPGLRTRPAVARPSVEALHSRLEELCHSERRPHQEYPVGNPKARRGNRARYWRVSQGRADGAKG
jgi:hypothetical protein